MIPFNKAPYTGNEDEYVLRAMHSRSTAGDGFFTKRCHSWFQDTLQRKVLLTPSCTHALEMAAILTDIGPGDEVIMPSYTFVSTANAFVLRGAQIVFVDIRPDTMNIDETLIEAAITPRTKAIVPVHYAGVACEMDVIMEIAGRHDLCVIEDAAQGIFSTYKGRPLGTLGHLGAYSFHETKNVTSGGEGGLLILNDDRFAKRAEVIREKGTNRSQFFRGMVDKYSWVDLGSSYLPSDIQAAYLWGQLEDADKIYGDRMSTWRRYYEAFTPLAASSGVELPSCPPGLGHNAHMFYLKVKNIKTRESMLSHLAQDGIKAVFHYIPLHSASAAKGFSRFSGVDLHTTLQSERLLRLPLWFGMSDGEVSTVIRSAVKFMGEACAA